MTMPIESGHQRRFVGTILPWLVALGALLVYGLTLNTWLSPTNLANINAISGDTWRPDVYGPLYYLITFPLRWLPEKFVPLCLNLMAMVFATTTLALLAKSVALLPHNRTYEQRQRERHPFALLNIPGAWLPPLVAVLVCGLQLTFWERSTSGSGEIARAGFFSADEMFQLLIIAFIVWSLLEYRIDEKESRLTIASLVYGASITSNWAMIGLLPAFIASIIWIRGYSFFNIRFLLRLALFALAGLLLYLVLPAINLSSDTFPVPFWQSLKANLAMQKQFLQTIWSRPNNLLFLLAVPSLLPVLLISIRWASHFGDNSPIGAGMATWLFHLLHGFLLGICVWTMFDPGFSPRGLAISHGLPMSSLTLYYFCALSIGYFCGYFLLVFRPLTLTRLQRQPPWLKFCRPIATGIVWSILFVAPIGLIYKNLPQIRTTNGSVLKEFAGRLTSELPGRAILLSDDDRRLRLAQAMLRRQGRAGSYIFIETGSLKWPQYHAYLRAKYGEDWPQLPDMKGRQLIHDILLQQLMVQLSTKQPVYYLHPSFGYYFERFYPVPHGHISELVRYTDENLREPLLTPEQIEENERLWREADTPELDRLVSMTFEPDRNDVTFRSWMMQKLHIRFEPNTTAAEIVAAYSQYLNTWGVRLQRSNKLPEAGVWFERALELNPRNVVAEVNLDFNERLATGQPPALPGTEPIEEKFGSLRRIINSYGQFDEPNFCFEQGRAFAQNRLFRQAAQQFERAREVAPGHLRSRLWLARLYLAFQRPGLVFDLTKEIRDGLDTTDQADVREGDVIQVEVGAYLAQTNLHAARSLIEAATEKYIKDDQVLHSLVQVCTLYGQITNALEITEAQIRARPRNLSALSTQGFLYLQLGQFDRAIPALEKALDLNTNNHPVRMNRAIAYLMTDKLDEARQDYEILQKSYPNQYQIHYGLGEIAFRKKESAVAIRHYENYLTNAPPDTIEANKIKERLVTLKAGY